MAIVIVTEGKIQIKRNAQDANTFKFAVLFACLGTYSIWLTAAITWKPSSLLSPACRHNDGL